MVRSIGGLFDNFLDICKVLLMHVCNLGNLEIDLSVMLILVMLVIWIRGGYVFTINGCAVSRKVSLHATVALPTIGAEIWPFLKLTKKLFG